MPTLIEFVFASFAVATGILIAAGVMVLLEESVSRVKRRR